LLFFLANCIFTHRQTVAYKCMLYIIIKLTHLPTSSLCTDFPFLDRSSQYVWSSAHPASPFTLSKYMP